MKQLLITFTFFVAVCLMFIQCSIQSENKTKISLAGEWQVTLDSLNVGVSENWSKKLLVGTSISLPATLDDAGIGKPNTLEPAINNYVMSNLARKHQYIGVAWYQKEIEISKDWMGKHINLSLERVLWESKVYVDGNLVGSANSLIGDHVYNLSSYLTPGKHLLTISIDNSNKFPLINIIGEKYPDPINQEMAHSYTNQTQIKWNGILGDILLETSEVGSPKDMQVYPNFENNKLGVSFEYPIFNAQDVNFEIATIHGKVIYNQKIKAPVFRNGIVHFEIDKPEKLELWDEFNPVLYDVKVTIDENSLKTRFGYKSIANKEGNLTLNGTRIFLRGNLECVIFPLTGHPPMEKEAWAKLITQAKSYGLNHLRFHSWCPPKAAFEAADEAGFYFQVELPHWSLHVGEDEKTTNFLKSEGHKIITDYGNHPSFIFMVMGK